MPHKEMMRFRPIGDALRCLLSNTPSGPNLASPEGKFTPQRLPLSFDLLKEAFSPRNERCTLVRWDGLGVRALASATMRAGPRAWEVDRLYVAGKDPVYSKTPGSMGSALEGEVAGLVTPECERELVELLEGLSRYAGSMGAERVFLRIPFGSPLAQIARRTGFFPYFNESLLQGGGRSNQWSRGGKLGMRPRFSHEEHEVFQLYSASTPGQLRVGLGMTFHQWRDSRDGRGPQLWEEVYVRDGKIRAWLGLDSPRLSTLWRSLGSEPVLMRLMVHPDEVDVLPVLLDHALARAGDQIWLVPGYQEVLKKLLIHRGFKEVAHYSMLIKTTAAEVKSPSLAPMEARVW